MWKTTIFLLVSSSTAPVVHRDAATLPIAHRIPVNVFVRAQDLTVPEAGIAPEFRDPVESGEYSCGDAFSLSVTCPHQQQSSRRFHVLDQQSHPVNAIGWHQALLGEDIFQLLVVCANETGSVS